MGVMENVITKYSSCIPCKGSIKCWWDESLVMDSHCNDFHFEGGILKNHSCFAESYGGLISPTRMVT